MIKHGTFTSVWDMGEITTPATLDTENGHVETDSVEVSDEYEVLHSEYFTDEDDSQIPTHAEGDGWACKTLKPIKV